MGYGSTNERGKHNLLHIVDHLARLPASPAQRAEAVREARTAALAGDAGRALDIVLVAHGAPPWPVREQPIRWHRRQPSASSGKRALSAPGRGFPSAPTHEPLSTMTVEPKETRR